MFQPPRMASGPSMRFFAWLIRDSAARGGSSLSSIDKLLEDLLHRRLLIGGVVDHEVAREADGRRLAAQQPRAERVERRDPQPAAVDAEQAADALAHLLGGLVREGDREHLVRLGEPAADRGRRCGRR